MIGQAMEYYESSFYIYQALKGELNKKSAEIGYKLASGTFKLFDLEKSKKFSSYCLRFYNDQEQMYMKKIIDMMILELKISKEKKKKDKTIQISNEIWKIWEYMSKQNYTDLSHISDLMKEYVECYLSTLD